MGVMGVDRPDRTYMVPYIYIRYMDAMAFVDFFIVFTVYPRRLPASFWNRSGSSMLALLDARLSSVSGTF